MSDETRDPRKDNAEKSVPPVPAGMGVPMEEDVIGSVDASVPETAAAPDPASDPKPAADPAAPVAPAPADPVPSAPSAHDDGPAAATADLSDAGAGAGAGSPAGVGTLASTEPITSSSMGTPMPAGTDGTLFSALSLRGSRVSSDMLT